MSKSEKGPVSQHLVESLSEIDYVHQYIEGRYNSLSDAASRYPMLGPHHLAPRGLTHSVQELLQRIPDRFRQAKTVHVHAGSHTTDIRKVEVVQDFVETKGAVTALAPVRRGPPSASGLAIMVPRAEIAPVSLALYLMSAVPFAFLVPVDLASQSYRPNVYPESPHLEIQQRFQKTGKITFVESQMMWMR